jgi:hypothetical protein
MIQTAKTFSTWPERRKWQKSCKGGFRIRIEDQKRLEINISKSASRKYHRSAPVLGRSKLRLDGGERIFWRVGAGRICCARGRARSALAAQDGGTFKMHSISKL